MKTTMKPNQSVRCNHQKHFPLVLRLLAGTVLAALLSPAFAADDDGIGRFEIRRFEVTGNTLLGSDAVEKAVSPYTGKERNFGHVQQALEALESVYHALGYNVVQVALP